MHYLLWYKVGNDRQTYLQLTSRAGMKGHLKKNRIKKISRLSKYNTSIDFSRLLSTECDASL